MTTAGRVDPLPRPEPRAVRPDEGAPADPAEFREVLGNFASGVTVIAAPGDDAEGGPRRVRLPVVLRGVPAWIDCAIHAVHTGGDHLVVIGRGTRPRLRRGGR